MVFPVIGGDGKPTGYEIDNSLRFNDDDDPSLSRTPSSASNRKTWTWSGWVKRSNISLNIMLLSAGSAGQGVYLTSGNQFQLTKDGVGNYGSTALLRDVSAWYHLVVACDTTQTGMANIAKFYINGTEQSTSGTTIYSTNEDTNINDDVAHYISRWSGSSAENHHDGYLADINFVDGLRLDASYFGETNDNGVWIPKKYAGSYGTNGFFLEFQQTGTSQNSSGMGADTSGNDHHFAVTNIDARDVCVDTPTNNFCTFNVLDNAVLTLLAGACQATHSTSSGGEENRGTMGFANGKWYWEFQIGYGVPGNQLQPYGIGLLTNTGRNPLESDLKATEALAVFWYTDSSNNEVQERIFNTRTTVAASEAFADNGDIVQFAVDADAGKVWVGKNNTWLDDASGNVGDPANGNNPIHTYTVAGDFIFPAIVNVGSQGLTILLNTGNPSFAISSGNADGNGYGNFEYAVPSGFYSICSKNLAEYG